MTVGRGWRRGQGQHGSGSGQAQGAGAACSGQAQGAGAAWCTGVSRGSVSQAARRVAQRTTLIGWRADGGGALTGVAR
jgi:hypothetical protein